MSRYFLFSFSSPPEEKCHETDIEAAPFESRQAVRTEAVHRVDGDDVVGGLSIHGVPSRGACPEPGVLVTALRGPPALHAPLRARVAVGLVGQRGVARVRSGDDDAGGGARE